MTERTASVEVACAASSGWGSAVRLGTLNEGSVWATANHVVSNPNCAYSIGDTGVWLMGQDKEADLALLWRPGGYADIGHYVSDVDYSVDPYLGMDLWAVGYPVQRWTDEQGLQVTRGVLVARHSNFWQVSASFWRGSSGGPVFDARGRLVGIQSRLLHRLNSPVEDQYFIAPAGKVRKLARKLTKNFSLPELACRCGRPVPERLYGNAQKIAERAQVLRDELGTPLLVVSGYRTPAYNQKVGGATHSLHRSASALDLRSARHSPQELAKTYEKLISEGLIPDGGLGVYDTHVHIDTGKPRRWYE